MIHDSVAQADIALPGLDDAVQLTQRESPEDIVAFYQALGPPPLPCHWARMACTWRRTGVASTSPGTR